jgi:cytochrome o ubiquinol oxidase subunit 2
MKRNKHYAFAALLSLCVAAFLGGCSNMILFNPKGPIGDAERLVIIIAFVLMLIVVIPAIVMAFWFPLRYRASNTDATYQPKWSHSAKIESIMWLVPFVIVAGLGFLVWTATYQLDPYKPIDPGIKPIKIEAISLDWKWLFIYPDLDIASVNQIVFPAHVPLSFRITSDTVMTSFFIPQLGSQIYAMAGMQTRLHLLADEPGTYFGQNQQFSGRGFSDMNFKAIAVPQKEFEAWVDKVKQSPERLDPTRYEELLKPSIGYPVKLFSSVEPDLFDHIIAKYMANGAKPAATGEKSEPTSIKIGALEER